MPLENLAAAPRPQKVPCPPPTRARPADRLAELFLHAWERGRFTRRLDWPPQNRRHVAVIASDSAGQRLALDHVRVSAFENHQEERLQPIVEALQGEARLDLPDRCFRLRFYPNFLDKALSRHGDLVCGALLAWAVDTLPALPAGRDRPFHLAVPVRLPSGKAGRVRVDVEVGKRETGMRPVSVGNYGPADPQRLRPVIQKALAGKLPRLVEAPASLSTVRRYIRDGALFRDNAATKLGL